MTEKNKIPGRRTFLGTAGAALGAAAAIPLVKASSAHAQSSGGKLRLAMVGTGSRGLSTWGRQVLERYSDVVEFVGLCDINSKRVSFAKQYLGANCPTFSDIEFEEMVKKTRPDKIIVTTVDAFHAKYICRALELGCDVLTEKPIATDEKMCQEILDTERRTGRKVTITFNNRYSPDWVRVKQIMNSGELGKISSVDFASYLDTNHGSSYFRRWHAYKQNSGSLFVHKATHRFDLVNWWLESEPVEVNAFGELAKYGYNGTFRGKNCRTCQHQNSCEFFWDITKDDFAMKLYVECESEDGYIRDSCVYRKNINTWDTMAVQVRYHNNVVLNYSLNAFVPFEGYHMGINGTQARLDVRVYHRQPWDVDRLADIRITPLFKNSRTYIVQPGEGSHQGADNKMKDMIFRAPIPDPLGQAAGSRDGVLSALIGVASRRSIEQQRPIKIEELVKI